MSVDWKGQAWQIRLSGQFKDFAAEEDLKIKAAYESGASEVR
jgi:hypothetical protein